MLAWLVIALGNLTAWASVFTWWAYGWRWALVVLIAGPLVALGVGYLLLVALFFFDAHEPTCRRCGQPAPMQLRGPKYRRPFCDACDNSFRTVGSTTHDAHVWPARGLDERLR